MLSTEVASEQLSVWYADAHLLARLQRAAAHSSAAESCARSLLLSDTRKPGGYKEQRALQRTALLQLRDPALRAALFEALFARLHPALEAAWQLCKDLPYTVGYVRRGFRAPAREDLAILRRWELLVAVCHTLGRVDDAVLDPQWLAIWAVHLHSPALALLLAGALNLPDSEGVLEIVQDCAAARHPIGGPGQHALRALLSCSRPAAWEFVGQLLVAAQRQEGLRQSILEAIDEVHPDAFPILLERVIAEDLQRFAAVARAVSVWLGEEHNVLEPKPLRSALLDLSRMLGDPQFLLQALADADPKRCYRALWCTAFRNADAAVALCTPLLHDANPARRMAAAHFLNQCGLPDARPLLLTRLEDPHPELVAVALQYVQHGRDYSIELSEWEQDSLGPLVLLSAAELPVAMPDKAALFERLTALIERLPSKAGAPANPLVTGWHYPVAVQQLAADRLVQQLGERAATDLLPWLDYMSPFAHAQAISKMCEPGTFAAGRGPLRERLLASVGHPSGVIREAALKALEQCDIDDLEALQLEQLLSRTQAEFRRAVLCLLLGRADQQACASVSRLLSGKHAQQRAGGIELARQLIQADRNAAALRTELAQWCEQRAKRLSRSEADAVAIAIAEPEQELSQENCLGLIDPARRTPALRPRLLPIELSSDAAVALLQDLDGLIESNKTLPIEIIHHGGRRTTELLGSLRYFPHAVGNAPLPVAELWLSWNEQRPVQLRDPDGLELLRALLQPTVDAANPHGGWFQSGVMADVDEPADGAELTERTPAQQLAQARASLQARPPVPLRYPHLCTQLLYWLLKLQPPQAAADFLLDGMETSYATLPESELARKVDPRDWTQRDWREQPVFTQCGALAIGHWRASPHLWDVAQLRRLHGLLRWFDQPHPQASRHRPDRDGTLLLQLHAAGAATIEDVYDELIGPRCEQYSRYAFAALCRLTRSAGAQVAAEDVAISPEIEEAVATARQRLLEVELKRGEAPTLATGAIKSLSRVPGLHCLLQTLRALGKLSFRKLDYHVGDSKAEVLTQIARVCVPLPADTPVEFAAQTAAAVQKGDFPQARLLELALLNPRWTEHVACALAWPGLAEAVYWFIAHTPSDWQYAHNAKLDEGTAQLQAAIRARTQLSSEQRQSGLVDVPWFTRAYAALGSDARWDAIEAAARFLGWGLGHRKAARLADVLLGRASRVDIVAAIEQRQLKEYVGLLGLLPLPADSAARKAEIADRYAVLQRYTRYAKGLSAMSKPAAMSAVQLGMDNLAITAGYSDPLRMQWSLSADLLADLLPDGVRCGADEYALCLRLDADGIPELLPSKSGVAIKSLPTPVRKLPQIAALIERHAELKRLRSASVQSLEQAMCQGAELQGAEIHSLLEHPLLRPLLQRLLLIGPGGIGYPLTSGRLQRHDGTQCAFSAEEMLRIAHPVDLLKSGDWSSWQSECLRAERVQPFKQVFRELYVPTAADLDGCHRLERYAGQQINPSQANALWASRGWSVREGVSKLFGAADLLVELEFDGAAFSPTESEAPTIGGLHFHRRSDWQPVLLSAVPALIFSECLRDLDLVVSVAHAGGVDPEASHSTIEMRAALLRETCALLALENVRIEGRHALIVGSLAHYSVHLGSASVHRQPGGALSIVAVQGQHRGRLFLPFADNDPRTAEVLSKVLLLARDQQIQDPTILAQIG